MSLYFSFQILQMGVAEEILSKLAEQREEEMFCDVKLEAEQQSIPAHKNVLAAASPYFTAMFSGR